MTDYKKNYENRSSCVFIQVEQWEKIKDYNRITVGTREQMQVLIDTVAEILEGRAK